MRKKTLSGAQKVKKAGRLGLMITVTPEEKRLLAWASECEGRCVSQFVKFHALDYARLLHAVFTAKTHHSKG